MFNFNLDTTRRRDALNCSVSQGELVHNVGDGITVNYIRDYPGGVTVRGEVKIPKTLRIQDMERVDASWKISLAAEVLKAAVWDFDFSISLPR